MAINYKKGFYRIWVIFSMLWIGASLLIFTPTLSKDFKRTLGKESFDKAYELAYKLNLSELSSAQEEILSEAIKRQLLPEITFSFPVKKGDQHIIDPFEKTINDPFKSGDINRELLNNAPVRVTFLDETKNFPPGTKAENIWADYQSVVEKYCSQKRNKVLLKFSAFLLSPPIVLLFIGISIAWVIKGFKNSSEWDSMGTP